MAKRRRWSVDELQHAVKESKSFRQVLIRLKLREAGGNYGQIKKYIHEYRLNIEHFHGKVWNKGLRGVGKPRIALSDILKNGTSFQSFKLKKRLFHAGLKKPHCEECGWAEKTKDGYLP